MSHILCIESGTSTCSVSVAKGEKILALTESHDPVGNHARNLTIFIQKVLSESGIAARDLSAVAVSKGPGSYTGLRIGVSVAKGICYGAGIPLIAVSSLEAMAIGAREWLGKSPSHVWPKLLCPMIDARRMEVYTQLFTPEPKSQSPIEALIIDCNSYADYLGRGTVLFFGNGSAKAKEVITHPNALYIEGFMPSSRFMAPLAHSALMNHDFVDTAYFEPHYLKDFVATKPKNALLGGSTHA